MPFESPAPRALVAGRAENKYVISLGIADEAAVLAFEHVQDVLKKHDIAHLGVAAFTQDSLEECVGQFALLAGHVLDLQALTAASLKHFGRNEMPVGAGVAFEIECSLFLLGGFEAGEQRVCCLGHVSCNIGLGGEGK